MISSSSKKAAKAWVAPKKQHPHPLQRAAISSFKRAKPDGLAATITPSAFVDALRLVLLDNGAAARLRKRFRRHCIVQSWRLQCSSLARRSGGCKHPVDDAFPGETRALAVRRTIHRSGWWCRVLVARRPPLLNTYTSAWHAKAANDVELWPMLLHKACAKLAGSYDALAHLPIPELVAMMTGGVVQTLSKSSAGDAPSPDLLSLWLRSGCLLLCAPLSDGTGSETSWRIIDEAAANGMLSLLPIGEAASPTAAS